MVESNTEIKPCAILANGSCACKQPWCQYECGRCKRHCKSKKKCPNNHKKKPPLQDVTNKAQRDCSSCKKAYCSCGSGLCKLHCICGEKSNRQPSIVTKTPTEKRSNYDATRAAIAKSAKVDGEPITPTPPNPTIRNLFQVLDENELLGDEPDIQLNDNQSISIILPVETLEQLLGSFGIDNKIRHNFPSEKARCNTNAVSMISAKNNASKSIPAMVSVLLKVAEAAAAVILPGDPAFLMKRFGQKLSHKYGSSSEDVDRSDGTEKAVSNLFSLCKRMPKHSMGYRVCRAVVVESISKTKLLTCFESMDVPRFGRDARSRGLTDFNHMFFECSDPQKKKRTIRRTSDNTIERAVEHILSSDNVGILAWGTTRLGIPGTKKSITFPRLTRKCTLEGMWKNFQRKEKARAVVENRVTTRNAAAALETLKRSSYIEVASTLTAGQEKQVKSVDYVTDQLVNEKVQTLQRIIMDLAAPVEKKNLTHHLCLVQNFLKYQYDSHARKNDGICTHSLEHGLSLPTVSLGQARMKSAKDCPGCSYLEYFMRKMLPEAVEAARTSANSESVTDALKFIEDSLRCFHLFQGHRLRVCNQQDAFSAIDDALIEECLQTKMDGTTVAIIIDWKMKFEDERFRESSMHNFGKRGSSWHEAVAKCYKYETKTVDGQLVERAVPTFIALDQLLEHSNMQDGLAVLSDLEALMVKVSTELPWIKRGIIKSDNAGAYHKKELLFAIPILNATSKGIKIIRVFHSETQDGKDVCDSHGAIGHRKVIQYLTTREFDTEYRQVCTSRALATALAWDGGLQNSAVQLMRVDRAGKLKAIEEKMERCCDKALEYFSRANDHFFSPAEEAGLAWAKLDLTNPENWSEVSFDIKVYAYSGIGNGATFAVNLGAGTFAPVEGAGKDDQEECNSCTDDDSDCEEDNDLEDADDDEFARQWESIHNHNDDSDEEDLEEEESEIDSDFECEPEDEDNARSIKEPPASIYDPAKMVSGVHVTLHTKFGKILGKTEKSKKVLENDNEDGVGVQKSVLARAISIASDCIHSEKVAVRDGKVEMAEYSVVKGWDVPSEELFRPQGWARRPNRGGEEGMYGKQYITDQYRIVIVECFESGRKVSSDKMGPAQIREVIENRFPGLYRYPSDSEITKAISALFDRQKKGKDTTNSQKKDALSDEIKGRIREIINQFPDETGSPIEKRVSASFGRRKPDGYDRKKVMDKVNQWRQAAKKKKLVDSKRRLIG